MPIIEIKGKRVEVDENGYLVNADDWSRDISEHFASEEGIKKLTDDHWKLINYMRNTYNKTGFPPVPIEACKRTGLNRDCVQDLLSISIRRAYRIAGLPQIITGDVG